MLRRWILANEIAIVLVCAGALVAARTVAAQERHPATPAVRFLDHRSMPLRSVELGSNLLVGLAGLERSRHYEVHLRDGTGELVSWARVTSTADGTIPPFALWYQTGIVGCTRGTESLRGKFHFRSHADAAEKLSGRQLLVEVVGPERKVVARSPVAVGRERSAPALFAADARGCLINAVDRENARDAHVAGRGFPKGSIVEIFVTPAQARWNPGDPLRDVRRNAGKRAVVRLDPEQRDFTVPIWNPGEARVGSYDLVVRHYLEGEDHDEWMFLGARDLVAGGAGSSALVVQAANWAGNANADLSEDVAGRRIFENPWFEHFDTFLKGQDVWGAIDPKRKPASNPYSYAAWYVVEHKDTWADGDALVDVTGGAEITPVQPGCINHTWTLLWANPNPALGSTGSKSYDVVIHFGNYAPGPPVTAPATYAQGVDFIDRADMPGFTIMEDPTTPGPFAVGTVDVDQGCDWSLDKTVSWTNEFVPSPVSVHLLDPRSPNEPCCHAGGPQYDPNHSTRMLVRIKYPRDPASTAVAAGGPYPLVVFLHGQQGFGVAGYVGYDYILDLLASHGFIGVSIDSNDFLDANHISRGELLREHVRRMRDRNAAGAPPVNGVSFAGKIDLSKVVVAGHSKGGEAAVAAYELQRVAPDTGYSIGGIVAIAPVQAIGDWGTTYFADPAITLRPKDVPYLILHGAKDGDVSDFQGLRTYDYAAPHHSPGNTPKQMVFIKDANHDFFNTSWITPSGESAFLGDRVPNPLAKELQQATAKLYVRAFVEAYVRGRKEHVDWFTGLLKPPFVPAVEVVTAYDPPGSQRFPVDHHEETNQAARLSTVNSLGGPVSATSLDLPASGAYPGISWNEYQLRQGAPKHPLAFDPGHASDTSLAVNDSFPHMSHGLVFGWSGSAGSFTTEIPTSCTVNGVTFPDCRAQAASYTHLSFRTTQVFRESGNQNPAGADQDLSITAEDSAGHTSPAVWVSSYRSIPYPWVAKATSGSAGPKSVLRTVRIPLRAFTVNWSQVDLAKLKRFTFRLDRTAGGEIAIDDIELVR